MVNNNPYLKKYIDHSVQNIIEDKYLKTSYNILI